MSKIGIIIKREYTTRVMKKSFIILTFLTPLFFIALMLVPSWLATLSDDSQKHIVVIDKTGLYHDVLKSNEVYTFDFVDKPIEEVRQSTTSKDFRALLYISENLADNPKAATLYYEKQVGVELKSYIVGLLNKYTEEQKLASYNIPNIKQMVEDSKSNIDVGNIKWGVDGEEKEASAELAFIIGMAAAMLIYIFIILYGTQVMNGVMQEKTNRIVEVIVSSVRPFDLMMGKIIGVALVGLTQFLMWVILTGIGLGAIGSMLSSEASMESLSQMSAMQGGGISEAEVASYMSMIMSFNWLQIGLLFIVFFLGGYLLYASLFAAIGSSVDNETDANQFTLPITLPIIIAIFAAFYAVRHPDSAASFWFSIIPFTSPVVMMVRLPFDVPAWEIILSISVLVLSFIGTTWLAGKIYRTGILMYGKKTSWKELWKWLRY